MTAITAFMIVTIIFGIGDIIALKTKGIVSSFVFTIIIFVIMGGTLHIFPQDMIEIAGLSNILVTYGMALTFVNIGCNLNFRELVSEWKTVVITIVGMVGVIIFCFTIGQVIFGREYALSAIGTICGGFGSTVVTSEMANAAGKTMIATFVTVMMTFQNLVGGPIASVCLSREARRFISAGGMDTIETTKVNDTPKANGFSIRIFKDTPEWMKTPMMYFAKLALIGFLGEQVGRLTGLNTTVCYLLCGFVAAELGFLERGSLKKSGGENLVLLGSYAYLLVNYLTLPLSDLVDMLFPVFGLLICGALIISVFAAGAGKLLKWSLPASIAVGVSCLLGYPLTYGLASEAVNSNTLGKNYTDEQIMKLQNHLIPKMVIGGVVSVSIVSVIIAGIIGPMIF